MNFKSFKLVVLNQLLGTGRTAKAQLQTQSPFIKILSKAETGTVLKAESKPEMQIQIQKGCKRKTVKTS